MTEQLSPMNVNGYRVHMRPGFSERDARALVGLVQLPANGAPSVLGGRSSVTHAELDGLGRVVVKHYTRGGVLGCFVRRTYLRMGSVRSKIEYDLLEQVREKGVNAPQPLAYISAGSLFYRTWLVTREIDEKQTLAEVSVRDEERAGEVMKDLVRQIAVLIEHGIYHVDLHPGNVLVKQDGAVYLVDFDKACVFRGSRNDLRDRYILRWRRAVIKHGLPELLSEFMSLGLRRL